MKSLRFERLWLLSESTQKARRIDLKQNANALIGTNHTGKSTVLRSLFYTLGCYTRPLGGEWDRDAVTAVDFSIQGYSYTILKRGSTHTLFDCEKNVLWSTSNSGELRDGINSLLNFVLPLTANKTGEIRQARPAFFFVPFFIDQDGSWDSSWRTFRGLGEFHQWERPTLDLALGIRSSDYWRTFGELTGMRREVEEIYKEQKVMDGARARLAERFPRRPWYQDALSFRRELKELESKAGMLSLEQDEVRNTLTDAVANRDALLAQIKLVEGALKAHNDDMRYLDERRIGEEIMCPTCGTLHEHSFDQRLNLEADADELRELEKVLRKKAKNLDSVYKQAASRLEQIEKQVKQIEDLLNTTKGKLKLRQIVDRAGVELAFNAFDLQQKQLNELLGQKQSAIRVADEMLSTLDNPKHAKAIRTRFNELYKNFASELELPPSLLTRKGEIKIKPQQGGSGGPRAVLAYYFAMSHAAAEFSTGVIPPLVIDSPHVKAQDEINRPIVTEFIFRNRIPGQQLIVGVEEALPSTVSLGNSDGTIKLREKFGLLNSEDFDEVMTAMSALVVAAENFTKRSIG